MGWAIIPAEVLNRHGRPQLYDHEYADSSRRALLQAVDGWEKAGRPHHAAGMRAAIAFFDRIGWLTPVRLREEG
jgi:hypothetical protein